MAPALEQGVQMTRHLGTIDQPLLRGAAAAIHRGRLDLAEAAYHRMGRAALALDMRARHGDWLAVRGPRGAPALAGSHQARSLGLGPGPGGGWPASAWGA